MPLNKTEDPGKTSDSLYYLHLACATNVGKEIRFKMDSGLPVCECVCGWGVCVRGERLGGVIGNGEAEDLGSIQNILPLLSEHCCL